MNNQYKDLAIPSANGYETGRYLAFLKTHGIKSVGYPQQGEKTLFNGNVAIRHAFVPKNSASDRMELAPVDHPNIEQAEKLLRTSWPAIYEQFGLIIREINPFYLPDSQEIGQFGSMSHQPPMTFGSMWATVNDTVCLAQAFVHEMAHNKLFALGQQFESMAPFFKNELTELYDSPVLLGFPRPISAVFHGVYAFIHVLSLDRRIFDNNNVDQETRNYIRQLIEENVRKVRLGLETLEKCAILSDEGKVFVSDVVAWGEKELKLSIAILNSKNTKPNGYILVGPAGAGKSTISRALAKVTQLELVSFDENCFGYWYNHRIFQLYIKEAFGRSKAFLLNKLLKPEDKENLVIQFISQGALQAHHLDQMKYDLITNKIAGPVASVFDSGAGHVVFHDSKYVDKLKKNLKSKGLVVVYVRPISDLDTSVDILMKRNQERGNKDTKERVRETLFGHSYRKLVDYYIDSNYDYSSAELRQLIQFQ